jgi:putative ABC transport system ATP-binding protein
MGPVVVPFTAKQTVGPDRAIDLLDVEFAWTAGQPVIAISQFAVAAGERVFLQGASGSGKSTLLGIIGGVIQPQSGHVGVLGASLEKLTSSERDRLRGAQLGFIFQMFNLIPYLTVSENVLLPLRFSAARARSLAEQSASAEAQRLLTALGLSDARLLNRRVTDLSIGQQQRVAAARALIGAPRLLIADEPTSSLDTEARADFLRLLMNECSAHATTLLFVSHDPALGVLFDRTVNLRDINRAAAPVR